jgi:predicted dehydrogenase
MTKLRIGVAGLGVGRLHVLALLRLRDRYDLVAVADPTPARRRQARVLGIKAVGSLDELLALGVDVVDICTPPHLHEAQIVQCLEAGVDVMCEKPLVDSVAAVDRLADAEARTGRRVAPVFQYRWGGGAQRLRRLVDAGIAGKLLVATSETMWRRGDKYYAVPWRGTWEGERGGAVLSHAIHLHDLLTWLGGDPAEVTARTATRSLDIEVEDTAAAVLTTVDGGLMTASVTLGAAKETSRLKFVFEHLTASRASRRTSRVLSRGPSSTRRRRWPRVPPRRSRAGPRRRAAGVASSPTPTRRWWRARPCRWASTTPARRSSW